MTPELIVKDLESPVKLEKYLKNHSSLPYSLVQKLIRKKLIFIDGKRANSSTTVENGQIINIKAKIELLESPQSSSSKDSRLYNQLKTQILNNIILKDGNIIAINKPAGIAVQGGSKIKICIDDIMEDLKFEKSYKPKLVHRLDKNTSGVLILARTREIAEELTRSFNSKSIEKKYLALTINTPKTKTGAIKIKISKDMARNKEKMAILDDGKLAETEYKVIENFGNKLSLIEYFPKTGRTHQLRVTSEYLGCPIIGDHKYGFSGKMPFGSEKNLFLHCNEMIFSLGNKNYHITADIPEHFKLLLESLK